MIGRGAGARVYRRPAVPIALLVLALGTQTLLAPSASAANGVPISGSDRAVAGIPYGPARAKGTITTFMAIPSGPVLEGTPVILIAQVAPANAAGTVQFKDGEGELGLPRPVIGGFVLTVTSMLTEGNHSLTAVFTAADQTAFSPSMPPPVWLSVIGQS